jgi:tetratricopeptide (TPR) repeat protein
VEAHNNYGGLLLQQGRVAEAIAQYEEVLRVNTNYVPALRNLAWLRAACADAAFRDGTQALELARQAVALTGGQDATALDALAAAQAEAGHFEEAVETARKAGELASAANQIPLVNQIEIRLKLYSAGSAYRLPK